MLPAAFKGPTLRGVSGVQEPTAGARDGAVHREAGVDGTREVFRRDAGAAVGRGADAEQPARHERDANLIRDRIVRVGGAGRRPAVRIRSRVRPPCGARVAVRTWNAVQGLRITIEVVRAIQDDRMRSLCGARLAQGREQDEKSCLTWRPSGRRSSRH